MPNINIDDDLFISACKNQNYSEIEKLLKKGCNRNISFGTRKCFTFPILLASDLNDLYMMKLLVETNNENNKCDLEAFNTKSRHATPLVASVIDDHYDIVEYLLSVGANCNSYDYSDNDFWENWNGCCEPENQPRKQTAIYHAGKNKNNKMVRLLLNNGAVYGYIGEYVKSDDMCDNPSYPKQETKEVWNFLCPILAEMSLDPVVPDKKEQFMFVL